ncbi:MAG: hypothetical protein ACYDAR_16530 [Thermomicrobiales bacterium]
MIVVIVTGLMPSPEHAENSTVRQTLKKAMIPGLWINRLHDVLLRIVIFPPPDEISHTWLQQQLSKQWYTLYVTVVDGEKYIQHIQSGVVVAWLRTTFFATVLEAERSPREHKGRAATENASRS